jgi:hypothetical protein
VSCVLAFSAVATMQAVSWFLIYTGVFPRDYGPETFGKRIWWNDLRPVHAVLHLLFALTSMYQFVYSSSTGISSSSSSTNTDRTLNYGSFWLVLDVCVGGIAHLLRYYSSAAY